MHVGRWPAWRSGLSGRSGPSTLQIGTAAGALLPRSLSPSQAQLVMMRVLMRHQGQHHTHPLHYQPLAANALAMVLRATVGLGTFTSNQLRTSSSSPMPCM